jgi:hypothetical protein
MSILYRTTDIPSIHSADFLNEIIKWIDNCIEKIQTNISLLFNSFTSKYNMCWILLGLISVR